MKQCVYCKTENRDEAIFCQHCRHPLPKTPSPPRIMFVWLALVMFLVGFGSYFFTSRPPGAPTAAPTSEELPMTGPVPTRTREPVTLLACVNDTTHIRREPSTQAETIGGLPAGSCLTILGRNEEGSWVYMISDDDHMGWVSAETLADVGDVSRVAIRDNWITVNPARATLTSEEIAHGAQVYLTRIAATNHPAAPLSQYVEPCFEAANRIGDHISCKMEKAYCDYFPKVERSPTICIDRPAPDHTFALVTFDSDWSEYDGQCLIISGYLEIYRGVLRIQALRRSQVSTCN
jgi:hypothetical protein